jgi:hypothetical protein
MDFDLDWLLLGLPTEEASRELLDGSDLPALVTA